MKSKQKIFSLNNFNLNIKKKNLKVVQCHGVFDLLHIGHIRHFNKAKSYGDILVVSITSDKFVKKGYNRPYFNEKLRSEALAALDCVDFVVISNSASAVKAINKIKPKIYCKGQDYKKLNKDITGKIYQEKKAIEKIGGKIVFTNDLTFSSSTLINDSFEIFDNDQKNFIKKIKLKFNYEEIQKIVNNLKNTKTLVLGEAIIDEYTFCEVIGKSGKEPILAFRDIKTERYAGGALAIANNLSKFAKVNLVSMIGEKKEHYNFIKKNLQNKIESFFLKKNNSTTIVKKRYVDSNNNKKLLGIYKFNDLDLSNQDQIKLLNELIKLIKKTELLIISDFGHGFLTDKIVKKIFKEKIYKSINAQINSSNIGFHSLDKYKNSNIVVINETELRHEMKNRDGNIDSLIQKLSNQIKAKYVIVTSGRSGVKLYNSRTKKMHNCPAFANKIVDKVGAGDTLLAIVSLLLYNNCDIDLSLFIASICAAESVESIGNSNIIDPIYTLKRIDHMMK